MMIPYIIYLRLFYQSIQFGSHKGGLLRTMLLSLVEVSNFVLITVILVSFIVVAISILRLQGEDWRTSVRYVNNDGPIHTPMMAVHNPFCFDVDGAESSYQAVKCKISAQLPLVVQTLWGVSITEFHQELSLPWLILREKLFTDTLLVNSCVQRSKLLKNLPLAQQVLTFSPPNDFKSEDLGATPRNKYPLVVILALTENNVILEDDKKTVGLMMNVIHLRDDVCSMQTCILSQYLKMTSGQVTCLRPLYVSNNEVEIRSNAVMDENSSGFGAGECVVCNSCQATMALLPCRHTCICRICFVRLTACPMCRGPISSYFFIENGENVSEDETQEEVVEEPVVPVNWRFRLNRWNDQINSVLGFT